MASISQQRSEDDGLLYGPGLQEGYIRLIRLSPSEDTREIIRCSLFEVSFTDAPRWEALSYMWGDASSKSTILINGIKIPIRQNLWDVLSHLRAPNERVLWIDAICINQENIWERNYQVKQMKRIYEFATRVIIWLAVGLNSKVYQPNIVQQLQAVKQLLARPYWKRLWIIQEIAVASRIRIQCGAAYTTWKHFSKFREAFLFNHESPFSLNTIFKLDETAFEDCITVFWLNKMRDSYQANNTKLTTLLEMFERAQCSDVRGKIYGLVGIANDAADLVIDYSKSPLDLFVDLILLSQKNGILGRDYAIPFARFLQRLFEGEVETPPIDSPYSSGISLVTEVYEAGTISYLGPTPDWDRVELKYHYNTELLQVMKLEACDPLTVMSISSNGAYAAKESKACKVTVKTDNGTSKDLKTERPSEFISTTKSMNPPTVVGADSATSILKKSEPLLLVNETGYIGIAPSNAHVSDTICRTEKLGPNRSVAIILRKIRDHYIVIGRAMFPDTQGENLGESEADRINLHLDIRTLQLLTKPSRDCLP